MVSESPIVVSLRRTAATRATSIENEKHRQHLEEGHSVSSVRPTLSTHYTLCDSFKLNRIHNVLSIATRTLIVTWMHLSAIQNGGKNVLFRAVCQLTEHSERLITQKRCVPLACDLMERITMNMMVLLELVVSTRLSQMSHDRNANVFMSMLSRGVGLKGCPEKINRIRIYGKMSITDATRVPSSTMFLSIFWLCIFSRRAIVWSMFRKHAGFTIGRPVSYKKIRLRWTPSPKSCYHIVCRALEGNEAVSPKRNENIEADVATNSELLCGKSKFNVGDQNSTSNAEEAYFMANIDNEET